MTSAPATDAEQLGAVRELLSELRHESTASAPAPMSPTAMARPPSVGVGFACTLRSFGRSIAPIRIAPQRTSGVTMKVMIRAQRPTTQVSDQLGLL